MARQLLLLNPRLIRNAWKSIKGKSSFNQFRQLNQQHQNILSLSFHPLRFCIAFIILHSIYRDLPKSPALHMAGVRHVSGRDSQERSGDLRVTNPTSLSMSPLSTRGDHGSKLQRAKFGVRVTEVTEVLEWWEWWESVIPIRMASHLSILNGTQTWHNRGTLEPRWWEFAVRIESPGSRQTNSESQLTRLTSKHLVMVSKVVSNNRSYQ